MLRLLFALLFFTVYSQAELIKAPNDFKVTFHKINFTSNTAFSDQALTNLLQDYINHPITVDKIHEAKELVTKFYISHGYVSSGALLVDQDITDGLLELRIIEGKLTKLSLDDETRFSQDYIWGRLKQYADQPLHFPTLQLPLYFLHSDRTIKRVNAELQPTEQFGESEMKLALEERELITFSVGVNNHKSPSVGDLTRTANVGIYNLTGWNETTLIDYSNSNGLRDVVPSTITTLNLS